MIKYKFSLFSVGYLSPLTDDKYLLEHVITVALLHAFVRCPLHHFYIINLLDVLACVHLVAVVYMQK